MSTLAEKDFISILEKAIVDYLKSVFAADALVTVSAGYPNFTGKLPLSDITMTVYVDDSTFGSSGYDEMVDVDADKVETRAIVITASVGIDVWSSRGTSENPSKSGGKLGAQRYFSAITRKFTIDVAEFYDLYPDADITDFSYQYSRSPESLDQKDLFQHHGKMEIMFPIEQLS